MNLIAWPNGKIEFLNSQGFSPTTLIRFWSYVEFTSDCWLWTGGKFCRGYGSISVGKEKRIGAHVLSWLIHFGPIPKGLYVLHNCPNGDNRACVNPSHLWAGSQGSNNRDRSAKGRNAKGEQNGNSKLTEVEVLEIREAYRCGYSQKTIGEKFGISGSQVGYLVRRRYWTHI